MSQGLQSLLGWHIIMMSVFVVLTPPSASDHLDTDQWQALIVTNCPIRSQIIVTVIVSCLGVCAVSSWCPRASLMSDLEKNNTKIHRAAENSTFLAKLCPDIREDWGWGKITRYCLTSNVMEPGHCSQRCQLYPEIGPCLINILIMKVLRNPFLIPGTVIVESEIGTLLDLKQ